MIYLAFMNPTGIWNESKLDPIVRYAHENNYRLRLWENKESKITIVCIELPYTGESTGDIITELMHGKFKSLGLQLKKNLKPVSLYTTAINC